MKRIYRGHAIEVTREECLGGWDMLYTSIFRLADGFECVCLAEASAERIVDQVRYMKHRIDTELASDDPWGERFDEEQWS